MEAAAGATDATDTGREEAKRGPFDELSRDDLIKKCRGLLAIAQKAKQTKQDLQTEVEKYKQQLEQNAKDKTADCENLQTLQELVDSLTEQKLNYITELDSTNSKNASLIIKCAEYEEKLQKFKDEGTVYEIKISELNGKLSNLDSENISLKRQKDRLQDENEELINQLAELEARVMEFNNLGLQQREQLRMLEESVNKESCDGNLQEYQNQIDDLNKKITLLENQLEEQNTQIKETEQNTKSMEERITETTQKYEHEVKRNEKANLKVKSYRDKIIKCGACITQLKNSRFILLKTVKDYSESIPKWQEDITKISKMLNNQFIVISSENKAIKQQIVDLEERLALANKINKGLSEENKILLIRTEDLTVLVESLQNKPTEVNGDIVETLNLQIKALESEKLMLIKEKQSARDSLVDLESQNKKYLSDNAALKSNVESLDARANSLVSENKSMKELLNEKNTQQSKELKEQLRNVQDQFDALKKKNDNLGDLNHLLREEVDTLRSLIEQPNNDADNLSDLNVSLQTDIMKLETKLAAYKQENTSLLTEVKESRTKIKELSAINAELEDSKSKLIGYKTENSELLNEMKEINQVLKERGESISKQQKAIVEMERFIETLEKDRDDTNESKNRLDLRVKQLQEELERVNAQSIIDSQESSKLKSESDAAQQALSEKESTISALKDEMEKLKLQHQQMTGDQPNEDMSTSTISRADENSRMKELDETFEDKYTKLRIFALKLKKRVNELTVRLESAETDKSKLEKMLSESGVTARNTQSLQQEYEKALNQVEEKTTEIQSLMKENEELQDKLSEISSQITDTVNHKSPVAVDIETEEQLRQRTTTLTRELEVAANNDAELQKLRSELAAKESQLSIEMEQHKVTKESLEKARRDVKKKSVLSLEMEDYERSMKDLTSKMEDNKKKIVQMESTIDTQQGTITSLKTQIKLLEDQVKSEENQNRLTKEELHNTNEELKEKESIIEAKKEVISKLEEDLETAKRVYEEMNVEMSSLLGEKEMVILGLSQDKAELGGRLKRVECRCSELEETLKLTNIELEDLKTEFTSYKVRAQAVLRQNQTVDHSQEERLKEELAAVKAQVDSLHTQLHTANAQLEELQSAVGTERRRAAEAAGEATRAQQRTARLHGELQRITQQLDSERAQSKLQISTLTQCYKTQISELECRLDKETQELKKELESARESANTASAVKTVNANTESYLVPVIHREDSDGELDINLSMLPREEGEGSESAPSPPLSKPYMSSSRGNNRSPVSLERLLEEGVPEDEITDSTGLGLTLEQELQDTKRKLNAQLQRVKHVTLLLAESERECARLSQLGELLKAEVRRARGTQQAHNVQYMKNVTLKFLTLPAGDERSRLVPVLQKILTLNSEETHTLAAVAKGTDPNSSRGWGSYLPWPGGK